jgi:hypothetical protein
LVAVAGFALGEHRAGGRIGRIQQAIRPARLKRKGKADRDKSRCRHRGADHHSGEQRILECGARVCLSKPLEADDAEVTRTRKVRRTFVEERYREVIEALYGDRETVDIDSTIRFQDGKTARIKTTLLVRRLSEPQGRAA